MFKKNKKGQVMTYIIIIFLMLIIVMIGAVFSPMGVLFNTEMYLAGQEILGTANESINNIQDPVIKASVQGGLNSAFNAAAFNIEVNEDMFQYSWVWMIAIVGLVGFMMTRRQVEVQGLA